MRDEDIEIGRKLNGGADFFVNNLLAVIGGRGHNLNVLKRMQSGQNLWRVFSSDDHHRRHFQHGPADQARRKHSHENGEHRHQEDRHDDHGNNRATVAERILKLLAIDDGDIAQVHPPTTRIKISSRSAWP